MGGRGKDAAMRRHPPPNPSGLASRADRLFLSCLLQRQRPLEHREGRGLGLALAALRLDRLLGYDSAQENSDRCGSSASSSWRPLPLNLCPLAGKSSNWELGFRQSSLHRIARALRNQSYNALGL